MGRTLPSINWQIEEERHAWHAFRRALRREERAYFDALWRYAKIHAAESAMASRALPFESMILSMLLEQQKQIENLQNKHADRPLSPSPSLRSRREGNQIVAPSPGLERGPGGEA